jgi:hypothetical protein
MTKTDFLKLRIRKYVITKNLKTLAADYFPVTSGYIANPKLYSSRLAIIDEMNNLNIVENNYETILAKVNSWLG